jgi:hypothetical protein
MKVTANYLRRLITEELDRALSPPFLFEQEDEEEEPAKEDSDNDAGEGEEKASDGASEEGEGDVGAGEGDVGDKDEEEEEEEKDETSPEPTGPTGFEFDEEINAAMAGFEKHALDVGAAKQEGRILTMSRFLFEAEDEEDEVALDVSTFADDTARLIANYDTLIDMEQAIYTKAVDFVAEKYGDDAADQLRDILSLRYDIEFDQQNDPEAGEKEVYATGATGGGGGAA